MTSLRTPYARVSRRTLMGAGLAGAALVPLASLNRANAGASPSTAVAAATFQTTSGDPVTWRTWLLASPDELRPAAPAAPTQAEIDEVVAAQTKSDRQ